METKVKIEMELAESDAASLRETEKEIVKIAGKGRLLPISTDADFSQYYWFEVTCSGVKDIWDKAEKISALGNINAVGPLLPMSSFLTPGGTPIPSDPTWNHKMTRFDEAISLSRKMGKIPDDGSVKINIAQLDTGYTEHPEIRLVNTSRGRNFIPGEDFEDARDPLTAPFFKGHGTSTASVIVGIDTSLGMDLNNGVFPMVNLVPYRIHSSVVHLGGTALPRAVNHAVDTLKCDVITISMGGIPLFSNWKSAVQHAYEKGVILTAAAGNEVFFVVWPARYPNTIAVAGINAQGKPWEGSCRGREVDISAPGECVYVAKIPGKNHDEEWESYNPKGNGTSFATPHVAAAAALWINHFSGELTHEYFQSRPANKVDAFCWALKSSANTRYKLGSDFGAGILDAANLLAFSPYAYMEQLSRLSKFSKTFAMDFSEDKSKSEDTQPLSAVERLDTVELLYYLWSTKAGSIQSEDDLQSYLQPRAEKSFNRLMKSGLFEVGVRNVLNTRLTLNRSFSKASAAEANARNLYTEALIDMLDR